MTLLESRDGVAVILFRNQVVGGRGRVGKHHVGLAFQVEPVSLGPAGGDRDNVVRKTFPDACGIVAIGSFHPHQKAETRRGGARILNHDAQVAVGQIAEIRGRVFQIGAMHKREIPPVIGEELGIVPRYGHGETLWVDAVGGDKVHRAGLGDEVRIKAQNDVGPGLRAFEKEPRKQRRAVASPHELQVAAAGFLERCLDRRAGAPVGDETVVSIDDQLGILCQRGAGNKGKSRGDEGGFHSTFSFSRRAVEKWRGLPA